MPPLTLLALVACFEALWRRRTTWRNRWDAAVTIGVACEGINVLCMQPWVGDRISPWLHEVTGVWNVEELIGHLLHLAGLMCVSYMALSRLKMPEALRRRIIHAHLELPAVLIPAIEVPLFVCGAPDQNVGNLVLTRPGPVMCIYWSVMGLSVVYVTVTSLLAFYMIGKNPAAKKTTSFYVFSCSVSVATVVAGVTDLIRPCPDLLWTMVRVELLAYSCAALYSRYHRTAASSRHRHRPRFKSGL